MGLKLSDQEMEALEGLPHLHKCLYIFGIRQHMDYATGITGIKREISYKSLAEEAYVAPRRGYSDTGSQSRDQVKRALIVLEQAGLIKRKSIVTKTEKKLVLECVLAKKDNSVQNKAAPYPPHSPAPQAAPEIDNNQNAENPYSHMDFNHGGTVKTEPESRPESRPDDFEKAARHPLSDTLHNITLTRAREFFQLLAKQGYYVNQLYGNKKTLAMVHHWVQCDVSLEEAQIGINHVNHQLGKPPESPVYYNKPVLQVRGDFEKAQKIVNEVKHDQTNQSTYSHSQRYPKSATKQFWENQSAILRQIAENED